MGATDEKCIAERAALSTSLYILPILFLDSWLHNDVNFHKG